MFTLMVFTVIVFIVIRDFYCLSLFTVDGDFALIMFILMCIVS